MVGEKNINIASVKQGISMMQHRLRQKKILLIIDDVDKHEQLQAIAGNPDWFGPGSRVIITTRDKQLLSSHLVEKTYKVKKLKKKDALRLLSWKGFKTEKVDTGYVNVMDRVLTYASGHPLALEVIGSKLFRKSIQEWESAINQYEKIPNNQILEMLKISFDALDEEEKSVFLDIACCFKGFALAEVEDILRAHYGACMKYHIGVLVEKSLIKYTWNSTVTLHDLIEDMGKEIVRQKSPKEPGKRSRLWSPEDIIQVLEDNSGTGEIEIICLNSSLLDKEETVEWNRKAFKKMKNLKTLIIKNGNFSEGPKYLPNCLRVLEWWKYPSQGLPPDFRSKKLAILESFPEILGKMEKITELVLEACDIKELPFSFQNLTGLQTLELRFCGRLRLPSSIVMMPKLAQIIAWESKGWLFPKQVEGEEKVSSMVSSNVDCIRLSGCKLSDEFVQIALKLHEAGNTMFQFSGAMFPEWFEHHSRGPSYSFWVGNKFPAIALCITIGPTHLKYVEIVGPIMVINGIECSLDEEDDPYLCMLPDHTYLFDLQQIFFADYLDRFVSENEWNHVEITYLVKQRFNKKDKHVISVFIENGIYALKQRSSTEDILIQFTDPHKKRRLDVDSEM
ncbi:unnamed protein product [Sphenostylis stenocarpa]|uniref:Uncharacterized protein n=1 Tax=Sphenostylis stenocarpa TaxID=92480 RepID=A0AA86VME8_9FABA|nr:unnamed protein product [Sphenostylis stenocarpa]